MTTGERIKMKREELHLSQRQLAEKLGTNQATIHKWEAGISTPRSYNLQALADALGVTPAYITIGDTTPKPVQIGPGTYAPAKKIEPAKKYSLKDKRKLDDIELLIRHIPDMDLEPDILKSIYLTVAEIRDDLTVKVLSGE